MHISKRLFLFAAGVVFFGQAMGASALLTPQIYFESDPILEKNDFVAGEAVKGTVDLWNYEESTMPDLIFNFQLMDKEVDGIFTQTVSEIRGTETFSLGAGQKATKEFKFNLPANLPKGNFNLRVQLVNSRGEEMSWADKMISIGGDGKFLALDNNWIVKNGQNLSAGAGVYYQPGEVCNIKFDVYNGSGFSLSAYYKITTYERSVGDIADQVKKETMVFKPGDRKTISAVVPKLDKPEVYFSEVGFYDDKTGEMISNPVFFRWIISGDGAKVLFMGADKSSYQAGEQAKVSVQYNGPADSNVEAGKGTINVKLVNQQGATVGEVKKEIDLKAGELAIDVPLIKNVDNPKIVSEIVKDDKSLDKYQVEVEGAKTRVLPAEPGPEPLMTQSFLQRYGVGIAGAMLALLAAFLTIRLFSKNKAQTKL